MKILGNLKLKAGEYRFETICLAAGVMLLDVVVYLLLELLLADYSISYNPGGGSIFSDHISGPYRLVYLAIYFWHIVNLGILSFLIFYAKRKNSPVKTIRKRNSKK